MASAIGTASWALRTGPWRIEPVRARLLEGLQPRDRVREVAPAMEVVLAARRQDEPAGTGMRSLRRRRDALGRSLERVDRIVLAACEVLDRASGEPGVD